MAFDQLAKFSEESSLKLSSYPITLVEAENEDFEFIADNIANIRSLTTLDHSDPNTFLYEFAQARRINVKILVKDSAPYASLFSQLGALLGVEVLLVS